MYVAKKDYEQFKQDVKSELSNIKQNQTNILSCIKITSKCESALLERLSTVEKEIDLLNNSIKNNIQNIEGLSRTVKSLSYELKKTRKSSETIFRQLSEALNMVMVQNILDKLEIFDKIADNSSAQNDNRLDYRKTCPTCGIPVSNSSGKCPNCGTNLIKNSNQDSGYAGDGKKKCPLCGTIVRASENSCVYCGHRFPPEIDKK